MLILALAAGCGEDGGGSERSRAPVEARKCLEREGFRTDEYGVDVNRDRDAPDHGVDVSDTADGRISIQIAFYVDLARAERLEPTLRDNAERLGGVARRIDRAIIIWHSEPPLGARLRVENCVTAS